MRVGQRYPAEGTTDLGHDVQTRLASGDLPANRGDRRDRGVEGAPEIGPRVQIRTPSAATVATALIEGQGRDRR